MMRCCVVVILSMASLFSFAQDSLRTLSEAEFLNIVRLYHPIAKQANLLVERAQAEMTASRAGRFD